MAKGSGIIIECQRTGARIPWENSLPIIIILFQINLDNDQ